ncbi:unnamed protein product [Triticum turgidum subsp. durum]|uniref:Uncharacterized protein n=1 Tax=Triticum turgidum subsp. durum TaxID=4567 RepID=A0A9R0Y249_TRITD|nr:unnamed protein product [Triticum turgidum subsp. durum]
MDYNEACKGSFQSESCEIGKIGVAKIEHYESELEEGEIREADEASGLESPIQNGTAANAEQQQVRIRQSASPQGASHNVETAGIVVLQHRVIHEHMPPSIVRSFVQDTIEKEQALMRPSTSPERASCEGRTAGINFVQQCKCSAIRENMAASLKESSTSSQVVVEEESSTSAERGSRLGGTACTAVVQQSKYAASEGRYVNLICDRDKENRIKERWIFEAKAGYLKKWFYVTNLSYSKFKPEELESCMVDYSDGEQHLKYFDMQSITTQIEAIASNKEPRGTFATDITVPNLENSPSSLETNEHTKLGFSVGTAEEMATLESRTSQYTCAPSMEFCHENQTQTTFPAADKNEGGDVEKPSACQLDVSAALEPAETLTTGKASDDCEPILEHSQLLLVTNEATKPGFSVGVSKEMATLESSSLQVTSVSGMEFREKDGTQIIFSAADSNEERNTESPCASRFVTSSASGLAIAVSADTENAAPISREKRRYMCSSNDISEGPCRSGRKLGEKDGTHISFSPATQIAFSIAAQNKGETMESPCGSQSVMSLASEPTIAASNGTENAASIYREKRRRIGSGNDDISEGSCCRPGRKSGEKDGTQITLSLATQNEGGDMERCCASHSDADTALKLVMTVNTDSQNAPSGSNEKQKHINSGNNISEGSCSRSEIMPTSNLFRTTLPQEEPPAARSPPPSSDNRQVVQAEDISGEEVPSSQVPSFAQVTEQPNMHFNTQSVINHHHFGSTCQFASPPYQPPCRDTHSARIAADSVGASHVHPTSANQVPTGSTPGLRLAEDVFDSNHSPGASHVHPASANQVPTGSPPGPSLAEDGLDLNLFTIELSRLQKLADLMTKRHQEKVSFLNSSSTFVFLSYFKKHVHNDCTLFRDVEFLHPGANAPGAFAPGCRKIERLNLAREIELAQAKRKYDELEYNLEVETLQRKRELKIKADKIYKQQILAEVLQVIFKASARVVPDSPRGGSIRTS